LGFSENMVPQPFTKIQIAIIHLALIRTVSTLVRQRSKTVGIPAENVHPKIAGSYGEMWYDSV
jgi:hypothetical protein